MTKPLYYASIAIMVLAFGLIIVIVGWLVYPYKVLVVTSAKIKMASSTEIVYKVDYCRYATAPSQVTRAIYTTDGNSLFTLPTVSSIATEGCNIVDVYLPLPYVLPKGTYYLSVNAETRVNPVRDVETKFKTNNFNIK